MNKTKLANRLAKRHQEKQELINKENAYITKKRWLTEVAHNSTRLSPEKPFGMLWWRSCPLCGEYVERYTFSHPVTLNSSDYFLMYMCTKCDYVYADIERRSSND